MDEVLAGDYYHQQTESVPEQTWSSASFFHAAVTGVLGLHVNGVKRGIVFASHLPTDWNAVTVRNVHVATAKIDLIWTRVTDGSALEVINRGDAIHFTYSPAIPLGSTLRRVTWNGKPIHAQVKEYAEDEHPTVAVELPHGTSRMQLEYSGGVALVLPQTHPKIGDSSHAMRLIDVKLDGATYTVDERVDSSRSSDFQLRTDRKIVAVHGATWKAVSPGIYDITVLPSEPSPTSPLYRSAQIVLDFDRPR